PAAARRFRKSEEGNGDHLSPGFQFKNYRRNKGDPGVLFPAAPPDHQWRYVAEPWSVPPHQEPSPSRRAPVASAPPAWRRLGPSLPGKGAPCADADGAGPLSPRRPPALAPYP